MGLTLGELTELSENGQIVITQKTYKDFKHTYEVFKNQSDTFLKVLHDSGCNGTPLHDYQIKLMDQMETFLNSASDIVFKNIKLQNEMREGFKKSPFHTKNIFHGGKNRKVSNNSTDTFVIANFLNTFDVEHYTRTRIISNNIDLKIQGPVLLEDELLISPIILSGFKRNEFGNNFNFKFKKWTQPEISYQDYLDLEDTLLNNK